MNYKNLIKTLKSKKVRGAFNKGIQLYAIEIVEKAMEAHGKKLSDTADLSEAFYLRGARNWKAFSRGACTLYANADIAQRLCSPSEYKKSKEGALPPNQEEDWLDVQTRALTFAWDSVHNTLLMEKYLKHSQEIAR